MPWRGKNAVSALVAPAARLRRVQRELARRTSEPSPAGIVKHRLAVPLERRRRLPHPDRLRANREQQKQGTGIAAADPGRRGGRRLGGQDQERCDRHPPSAHPPALQKRLRLIDQHDRNVVLHRDRSAGRHGRPALRGARRGTRAVLCTWGRRGSRSSSDARLMRRTPGAGATGPGDASSPAPSRAGRGRPRRPSSASMRARAA